MVFFSIQLINNISNNHPYIFSAYADIGGNFLRNPKENPGLSEDNSLSARFINK